MISTPRRGIPVLACLLLLLAAAAPGCSKLHAHAQGFASDASRVQVVSALVGGKNVYIPSTLAVAAGETTLLSIYNSTDVPHGFAIPALGIQVILPAQQEFEVELPPLEGPRLFGIRCHLHTAHRTATLMVMPAN